MIYTVWEFTVLPRQQRAFETAYNSTGVWAQLFRRDPAYRQTILIRDDQQPRKYLTLDVWDDKDSYLNFKAHFADEYQKIDTECEELTASERHIGVFECL